MSCKNTTICTQNNCGCPVPDLSARCVVYDGETLSCIGADIPDNLNNLLKKFDKAICEKLDTVLQKGDLLNIGNGIELYKGINNLGQREIKTLVSSDGSVIIEANTDNETVDIRVELPDTTIDDIADIPARSYNDLQDKPIIPDITDLASETYVDNAIAAIPDFPEIPYIPEIKHVGTGERILLEQNSGDQDYEVSGIKTLDGLGTPNANGTVSVYAGYNNTNKSHEFRNISGGTGIKVESSSGDIEVSSLYQHEQSDFTEEDSQQEGFIKNRLPSKTVAANYTLTEQDNLHVIVVDATSNDITITYDSSISFTEYFVGFVQKGSNNVTFEGQDVTPQGRVSTLYGEGHNAAIEKLQGDVFLFGSLKQL